MLKYIFKKYKIISATTFKLNTRLYQSQKGVYGFRPKQNLKNEYTIADDVKISRNSQCNVYRWVEAHKKFGHRIASIDPVSFGRTKEKIDQINFDYYELKGNENVTLKGIINIPKETETVKDLQSTLRNIYCGNAVSAEFSYIESQEENEWLSENFEIITQQEQNIPANTKKEIAKLLLKCQIWDNYLAVKFPSVKRYGAEGAENILTFFRQILLSAVDDDLKYLVIAMPHRGRGNLLTTMLNTRPAKIFRKFKGGSEFPNNINAMGDVVSHYNTSEDILVNERNIHVTMLRNPSHLEAVNPVSMGKTRSKQQQSRDGAYSHHSSEQNSSCALNIQLHGDAAFSGQGINQECLMMTSVPHFDIGGTIHMIVNNQIGFTTPADRGRSTLYASDLAKSIQAPVFHVNGDNPEILTLITKLAFNYQRKFGKDIFIDLNCFRRWGHNELDDPTFTNPLLYSIIQNRKSVPDLYLEKLISEEIMTRNEVEDEKKNYWEYLNQELEESNTFEPKLCAFEKQWKGFSFASNYITYWDTGLDYNCLKHIGITSVKYPKEFNIHSHLKKIHVEARLKKLEDGLKIDWSTAEALAIGSLMYQGHNVRISGEDVGRGTFSQRHAMLVDQITNEIFIPLNALTNGYDDGKLEIANSILSEEAVLGYEYGMAIDNPNNLFIWEAQFGDFSNGAQIVIDNFIVSGETKWLECNGLVMLLPHGYDGAGSEHSSCRIERFLQLTDSKEEHADGDDVNLHIINPTTSAQYYHALRRQILRNFRKPLIVVSPKVLLRLSDANSSYSDMQPGTYFRNVIGDDIVLKPNDVTKIILCSGKHYYNLHNERVSKKIDTVAIIRLESLCPFPLHEIQYELSKYKNAKQFIWSQEEARNMGPWDFIRPRFEHLIGRPLKYCGRCEGATAATGNGNVHRKECDDIVKLPFIV